MTICWKELILDLADCNIFKFDRIFIERYFVELCKLIKMNREDLYWWDWGDDSQGYIKAPDHLKGISAIQFITTSNITIHTLDVSEMVFLNVFSCKEFNTTLITEFSSKYFEGKVIRDIVIKRG